MEVTSELFDHSCRDECIVSLEYGTRTILCRFYVGLKITWLITWLRYIGCNDNIYTGNKPFPIGVCQVFTQIAKGSQPCLQLEVKAWPESRTNAQRICCNQAVRLPPKRETWRFIAWNDKDALWNCLWSVLLVRRLITGHSLRYNRSLGSNISRNSLINYRWFPNSVEVFSFVKKNDFDWLLAIYHHL